MDAFGFLVFFVIEGVGVGSAACAATPPPSPPGFGVALGALEYLVFDLVLELVGSAACAATPPPSPPGIGVALGIFDFLVLELVLVVVGSAACAAIPPPGVGVALGIFEFLVFDLVLELVGSTAFAETFPVSEVVVVTLAALAPAGVHAEIDLVVVVLPLVAPLQSGTLITSPTLIASGFWIWGFAANREGSVIPSFSLAIMNKVSPETTVMVLSVPFEQVAVASGRGGRAGATHRVSGIWIVSPALMNPGLVIWVLTNRILVVELGRVLIEKDERPRGNSPLSRFAGRTSGR